jgi:hypothetical protein
MVAVSFQLFAVSCELLVSLLYLEIIVPVQVSPQLASNRAEAAVRCTLNTNLTENVH